MVDDGPCHLGHPGLAEWEAGGGNPGDVGDPAQLEHLADPLAPGLLELQAGGERDEIGGQATPATAPFHRRQDVVLDRQPSEGLLALEGAADAVAGPPGDRPSGHVDTVEQDASRRSGVRNL